MFNRPIEVYHYSSEPINIFQGTRNESEPIRLSYHRSVHYNSIVDPFKATVGVGLGLPAYNPGVADRSLLEKAVRLSDEDAIEKAMLEDKLLATDWEATNEAIEEQVARESYLEWLRENENRLHKKFKKSSSPQPTTTAAACSKQHQLSQYPPSNSDQTAGCSSSGGGGNFSGDSRAYDCPDLNVKAGTSSSTSPNNNSQQRTQDSYRASPSIEDSDRRSPRASSSRDVS